LGVTGKECQCQVYESCTPPTQTPAAPTPVAKTPAPPTLPDAIQPTKLSKLPKQALAGFLDASYALFLYKAQLAEDWQTVWNCVGTAIALIMFSYLAPGIAIGLRQAALIFIFLAAVKVFNIVKG